MSCGDVKVFSMNNPLRQRQQEQEADGKWRNSLMKVTSCSEQWEGSDEWSRYERSIVLTGSC